MAGKVIKSKMEAPGTDAVLVKWEQEEAIEVRDVKNQLAGCKLIAHVALREALIVGRVVNELFMHARLEGVEGGPFTVYAFSGSVRADVAEDENRLDVCADQWLADMLAKGRKRLAHWM